MPGKVNPVIPEVVNQIAFEVIGNDVTITFAAEAGQLQLNAFEPVIAHSLLKSLTHLRAGCLTLAERAASPASPPIASTCSTRSAAPSASPRPSTLTSDTSRRPLSPRKP